MHVAEGHAPGRQAQPLPTRLPLEPRSHANVSSEGDCIFMKNYHCATLIGSTAASRGLGAPGGGCRPGRHRS